jgi:hypothetical protein
LGALTSTALLFLGTAAHTRNNRFNGPITSAGRFKLGQFYGITGETMAGKADGSGITSLPGIGAATAKKLTAAKLGTVAKLAKASLGDLQKAGLSVSVAKKVSVAAKAASGTKAAAKKAGGNAASAAKKASGKAASAAKKATSKAKTSTKKAAEASKTASKKAVGQGQKMAEKVVEKTKAAATTLKTTKDKDRKGSNIKVPKSVKDMPWFNKR